MLERARQIFVAGARPPETAGERIVDAKGRRALAPGRGGGRPQLGESEVR
jgi:hypothetical protein